MTLRCLLCKSGDYHERQYHELDLAAREYYQSHTGKGPVWAYTCNHCGNPLMVGEPLSPELLANLSQLAQRAEEVLNAPVLRFSCPRPTCSGQLLHTTPDELQARGQRTVRIAGDDLLWWYRCNRCEFLTLGDSRRMTASLHEMLCSVGGTLLG